MRPPGPEPRPSRARGPGVRSARARRNPRAVRRRLLSSLLQVARRSCTPRRHYPHRRRRPRRHEGVAMSIEQAPPAGMAAPIFDYLRRYRFKKVQLVNDTATGLRAVIAVHSTALGPAVGGLRMWTYPNEEAAIVDALRLARGMTYKYAAAGCDLGGGKAVIIGDPRTEKTEALLRAMGRAIDQMGGEYITGEDVGTTLADMEVVYSETDHVVTLPEHCGGAGDISPATARGTILAMRACAQRVWGSPELDGRTVAMQGLGVVGSEAVRMLVAEGAKVTVTDIDPEKVAEAVDKHGVASV